LGVVHRLLELGAEVNKQNNIRNTPLTPARVRSRSQQTKQYRKHALFACSSQEQKSTNQTTVAQLDIIRLPDMGIWVFGYLAVVHRLLESGAEVNKQNNIGNMPLSPALVSSRS
jgi:ankyrin repeat protein